MVDDNAEKFPEGKALWESLANNPKVTVCPNAPEKANGYAYNASVQNIPMGRIIDPGAVVITADSDKADNLMTSAEDIAFRHTPGGRAFCGYADGHVARVNSGDPLLLAPATSQ